ncbi:hypothetical protein ACE0DR_00930 [Azotobacter sp. CWF10]
MSKPNDHLQPPLRLTLAPPPDAIERLFRVFGDELIPSNSCARGTSAT